MVELNLNDNHMAKMYKEIQLNPPPRGRIILMNTEIEFAKAGEAAEINFNEILTPKKLTKAEFDILNEKLRKIIPLNPKGEIPIQDCKKVS